MEIEEGKGWKDDASRGTYYYYETLQQHIYLPIYLLSLIHVHFPFSLPLPLDYSQLHIIIAMNLIAQVEVQ